MFHDVSMCQDRISPDDDDSFVAPISRYLFVKFTPVYSATFCGDQTAEAGRIKQKHEPSFAQLD